LSKKKTIVSEVASVAKEALSVVVADYRGLTVSDMTALRAQARKADVHLRIVRNTLAKRALMGTSFECLGEALVGPSIFAFAKTELAASARLIKDFSKTNDKLKVKALSLGGQLLASSQLDAVAKLPTRDEAIARLLSVMQAPIAKLARTLAEPQAKLVRLLAAIRDQKTMNS